MKMSLGLGTITNYPAYVYNCMSNQFKYRIPVNSLQDVQLYIDIGPSGPGSVSYELIHTCGPTGGTIETLSTSEYVIGQDTNDNFYGVFRNFNETTTATCFVIAITLDGNIYFSQEYCIDTCIAPLTLVQGCYGNLDPLISYDREGIFFGQSQGGTMGGASVVYEHRALMRDVEVNINGIKNTFKKGRTRNFRTESEDIYLFWAEWIPGWYLKHIDAIFKRGEVYIGATKYLVESTGYELLDDCHRTWRPAVNLTESQFQSFSCEPDPCVIETESGGGGTSECCDPAVNNASVVGNEGNTITIDFTPCSPAPANGYIVLWRVVGSGGSYTNAGTFAGSPAVFLEGTNPDGTNYEGYIYSDCGSGIVGNFVPWSTGTASGYGMTVTGCAVDRTFITISGGTPGDSVTVKVSFMGSLQKTANLFTRADLLLSVIMTETDSSPCFTDTSFHGFSISVQETFVMTGATQIFETSAIINNSSAGSSVVVISIIDINGDTITNITVNGCKAAENTFGTC